jgi:hypothetical protein
MGLRDRLEEQVARVGDQARAVAASERVQRAGKSFRGFRAMLADDERDEEESSRDLYDVADFHGLDLGDEQIVQAVRGSLPVFRFGWYFDERFSDRRHAVNAAANERDRILQAIQWWI